VPDQPSLGEVMRRLDEITKRFEDTVRDVREFRSWAERLYVPRGEWIEGRRADQEVVRGVSREVEDLTTRAERDGTFRRQVLLALSVAAFSAIVSVSIAVAGLILGKGP
jgi:hypothetical protein